MRWWTILTFIAIALQSGPQTLAHGARGEDVSVESWIYDALTELSVHGQTHDLLLHTRPLSRGEIADAVREYRTAQSEISAGAEIILQRLEDEFREELAPSIERDHSVRLGIGPTARSDQFHHRVARNRVGFDAIGSITVSDALTSRVRVRFDSDGRHDSQFHGKYWKENFTAWVEQAVTVVRWKRFTGAFGREYWRWGRSTNDAMLMSENSPPFNGLRLQYRARNWSYDFHATVLDQMNVSSQDYAGGIGPAGVADRYLVAHRFNWRPRHNLEFAASEVLVFGGFERPFQWNYLNPILPYYWEQLNDNSDDNPLWNFELSWRIRDGLLLYGEWMLDDFQIDFTSEPQQIGVLLGGTWVPNLADGRLTLNAEYQRINTFVYGQGKPWNRYFHHRDMSGKVIGIGSNLGTDADRFTFAPLYHLNEFLDITSRLDYVRRGENDISDPQNSGVPKGIPFPSGVVESELRLSAGTSVRWRGNVVADATLGYYRVTNLDHVMEHSADGVYFQFRLKALWWKTFGV